MKITEVRDGFIKIAAEESIYLSSFVRVAGTEKDYIAQISSMKKINGLSIAYAKILFIMRDGILFNYDNTEPESDSEIMPFTMDILNNSINAKRPVIIGKTLDNSGNVVIDLSAFNKKLLISVDDYNLNNLLVGNLTKQFENLGLNTVIIDTNKTVKSQKYLAGKDFKLPLNKLSIQYLYNACLNEATSDSKQMIAEVFDDISEYIDSVPFVPFDVFKSVVDDIVDNQHVFKLFVLKNKLSLLKRLGYFAENASEAESLNKILESKNPVIDISTVESGFQNFYLEYIYSMLDPGKNQVLLETSNIVSKKSLKLIITESDVPTTLVVNSKYRYLNDIKVMFDNFIIEPTFDNKSVFRVYNSFLSSMDKDTYLITGEGINYIPVISKAVVIDEVIDPEVEHADSDVQKTGEEYDDVSTSDVDETLNDTDEEVIEDAKEDVTEDITEDIEEESEQEKFVSKDEIIANIEQKSEELIDSLSEESDEIQSVDLFTDEDDEDDVSEDISDESEESEAENPDENTDSSDTDEESAEEEFIEPEYSEIVEEVESAGDNENLTDYSDSSESDFSDGEILELNVADDNVSNDIEITQADEDDAEIDELQSEVDNVDTIDLNDEENVIEPEGESLSDFEQEQNVDDINIDEDLTDGLELLPEESDDEIPVSDSELEELSSDEDLTDAASDDEVIKDEEAEYDEDTVISDLDEIVELDSNEADDNDIIIDISDDENINIDEDTDRQIIEDVDKVYTTIKEDDDNDISDSDLDFIDELNSDSEVDVLTEEYSEDILEQPQESIIPEKQPVDNSNQEILEKRDSNTPIVPVYDADIPQEDLVISDSIQQGDSVVHAKYGNGIVEKMIKYGTKTLFSINFENIGRRLLDPTLTEIKKL